MDHLNDEMLGRYVGGLLDERQREAVDAHCAICAECARTFSELMDMNGLLEGLSPFPVPAQFPERVRARLVVDGDRRSWTTWRSVAAAVALLIVGGLGGAAIADRSRAPAIVRDAEGPKFMLIFAEDQGSISGASAEERERRMTEFLTWMRGLGDASVRLGGSQLDHTRGRTVGASSAPSDLVLSGFLVIRSSSYEEVEALARGCPIVARGGQVIVRRLM